MKNNKRYSLNCIDEYEYVSFDIFDTLIERDIYRPENLFKYIEALYNKQHNEKIENFFLDRVNAELKARKQICKEEINIEEIYNFLDEKYTSSKKNLMELELKIELAICKIKEDVKEFYDYAIRKNKKILIVSDIYLNRETIEKILYKNGIHKYEKLYISSELRVTKKTGNLFKHIINELNIKTNEIIHIGDHPISDNKVPNELGIKSIKIYNNHHLLKNKIKNKLIKRNFESIEKEIVDKFIENRIDRFTEKYSEFGYEKLGVLYYGFLQYIQEIAKINECEHIYFFSRDGYILRKAYNGSFDNNKISNSYLYVSRRAIIVPSLIYDYELQDITKILGIKSKDSIESFFLRVGLNIENYKEKLNELNLKSNDLIKENGKKFERVFEFIREDIVLNSKYELEKFRKYLIQENIDKYKKVLVVDIGWRGSMQYSLEKILKTLNIDTEIYGVYLGLNKESEDFIKEGMRAEGYLFSKKNNYKNEIEVSSGVGLIESLFLAPHGTVIGYENIDEILKPILGEYEYSKEDVEIIKSIQYGAIKFAEEFYKVGNCINIGVENKLAFEKLKKFIKNPSNRYRNDLGNLGFSDFSNGKLAKPESLIKYLRNPKELKQEFLISQWKPCFLKRLLKIKLPYFEIYKFLRKKFAN